jgi:GT2 family glycosyltransferase
MSLPQVVAVIPIHNGVRRTVRCLRSVHSGTVVPRGVIVVDDGSTDGSAAAIKSEFPSVEVLSGDGNLWWSGAMNVGVRHALEAGAEFVLSLNNDCVVDRSALETLISCAQENPRSVVGSKIRFLDPPEKLLSVGGTIHWGLRGLELIGWGTRDTGQYDEVSEVDWLPGMSVLIPRDTFREAGLYDDRRFPMSWGDVDFVLRARSLGWKVMVEPRSLVWNDREQTEIQVPTGVTLREAARLLTDIRSRYRLVPAVRFYLRHAPLRALPALLAGLYKQPAKGLRHQYLHPIRVWFRSFGPQKS